MPWLPFFDKIDLADQFVLLDCVQYRPRYFFSRCKVRDGRGGFQYLTIPVKHGPRESLICEKELDRETKLLQKMIRSIETLYGRAPFFKRYHDTIRDILMAHAMLSKLNIELIRFFLAEFSIPKQPVVATELGISTGKGGTAVVGDISSHLGATEYLSGKMGANYLDESYFSEKKMLVSYHDYQFTEYPQPLDNAFIPALSALDLLMNCGPDGVEHIRKGRIYANHR